MSAGLRSAQGSLGGAAAVASSLAGPASPRPAIANATVRALIRNFQYGFIFFSFLLPGQRRLIVVRASTVLAGWILNSILAYFERSSRRLTVELSAAAAAVCACHFIVHACAPAGL